MPKTIPVDPASFAKSGKLAFPEVPIRAYAGSLGEERAARGDDTLREVLRHMMIVREFESMLEAAMDLHRAGVPLDFSAMTPSRRLLPLPAFERMPTTSLAWRGPLDVCAIGR